jgi:hypothetical protein
MPRPDALRPHSSLQMELGSAPRLKMASFSFGGTVIFKVRWLTRGVLLHDVGRVGHVLNC